MLRKLSLLWLGAGVIFALSSATVVEAPISTETNTTTATAPSPSPCDCFAADFKWKPNNQTLACDAFFKGGLVPQPCLSAAVPEYDIVSVSWDFGDGNTGTGNPAYHIYGGPCPAPPTIVCVTIVAKVSNGVTKELCTYTTCKAITLS